MSSLKFRLAVIFSSLMLLGFGVNLSIVQWGIPFVGVEGRVSRKTTEILINMSLIADLKKERLTRWIEERKDDIKIISSSILLSADYNSLMEEIKKRRAGGELDSGDWEAISNKTSYRNLEKIFKEIIQVYEVYTKISIVNVESGIIQASTRREELGEVELIENHLLRILMNRGDVIAPIRIDERSGEPIVHLYQLIAFSRKQTSDNPSLREISILTFDVSMDDIIEHLLHTGGGLGKTGEVVLTNSDRKILAPLKFPLTDSTLAEPLAHTIVAEPTNLATRGEEGIIESIDYRGVEVLAAYRHIIISNDIGWGMVVKRDRSEAFAGLKNDNTHSLIVGISLLLVLFVIIYYVALLSLNPLNKLVEGTEQVAHGNLDIILPITGGQELERLSSSFNRMTAELKSAQEERFKTLFYESPVPLWEEDFSELYAYLEELKNEGVRNFKTYFEKNPDKLQLCINKITIKNVNQAVLTLHNAKNKEELVANFDKIFTEKSYEVMKEEIIAIALGQLEFESEVEVKTLSGEKKYIFLKLKLDKSKPDSITALLATTDITERKRVEDEIVQSRNQLRELSQRLESIREEERTEIARDIHDDLGQSLTALKLDISSIKNKAKDEDLISKANSMSELVDSTIKTVQRVAAKLRPGILDDLGLISAIEWQLEEFQSRSGIKCKFECDNVDLELDGERSTTLFRIFQELLTNIARHANASKVKVHLGVKDDILTLNVSDDGIGIREKDKKDSKSYGIMGISERLITWNGNFEITGNKEEGTKATVTLPLNKESNK